MQLDPTIANALIVPLVGVVITWLVRLQIRDLRNELKGDIAGFRSEVQTEFTDVKQDIRDIRTEMSAMRSEMGVEMGSIRSDLTQVALAVGARPRPQTG